MQNPRRVCLLNDSFPPVIDGVANAVENYAANITKNYGQAAVVTPFYPDADDSVYPFPVLRYPSVDVTKLVGYRAGFPLSPELMAKIEAGRFDLLHSHCPITSTVLGRMLRERLGVPLVFTYHTKFDIDIANAIRGKALQELAIRILAENISACDEVWTVSCGAGENLRSLGYAGDYLVMPNGVDFPAGRVPEERSRAVGAELDLPEDVPLYLFVGRMMWYKGLRITLDALKALADAGRDFRMVFVGGGGDAEAVRAYAASLGLDGRVFFCPPVYDREVIRAWYCRADLFLFPSTFDTNGLVVREAAACALPSVLVAGSCAAEDVTDGQNGFLIGENAESMAALLLRIGGERETLRAVGQRAQAELYISWESAVARACGRYEIVLENQRAGVYAHRERRSLSDGLLRGAAGSLDALNAASAAARELHENLEQDLRRWQTEAEENRRRGQEKLSSLRERMERYL